MRKTLWIAMICGLCAVMLLSIGAAFADDGAVFNYYKEKNYNPIVGPMDLNPIRFYVQDNHDGTYTLTLTLKNVSDRSWPAGRYDLLCKRGSNMLAPGSGPRWNISEDVPRGTKTIIQATLTRYERGARMVFYLMDGNNSFYGFYIRM